MTEAQRTLALWRLAAWLAGWPAENLAAVAAAADFSPVLREACRLELACRVKEGRP